MKWSPAVLCVLAACTGGALDGSAGAKDAMAVDADTTGPAPDATPGRDDAAPLVPRLMYVSVGGEERLAVVELGGAGSLTARPELDLALPGRPGAMAFAPAARRLYVGTRPGDITTVALDAAGAPSVVGRTQGTGIAVYLALARNEQVLVSASFGDDRLATHDVAGAPPHAELDSVATADEPHAALVDATGGRVYVPHRGGGLTRWYGVGSDGAIASQGELAAAAGVGPRHIAIAPDGDHAYLVHEFADSVGAHTVAGDGALAHIGTVSTLPGDADASANTGADVHVTPDGSFVYASNRGHDSLAMFRIEDDGALASLGTTPTEARPREFSVSPDGRFVVVAGQDSGFLQSYRVESDGTLTSVDRLEVGPDLRWVVID